MLLARPELRIQLAVYRYQKEEIFLAKAAELAGVGWAQMKDSMIEHGIPLRLGPETLAEAKNEIQSLRNEIEAQS